MAIARIHDAADSRLGDYADLKDVVLRSRTEPELGIFIAESAEVIRRALESGHRPRSVLMSDVWLERMQDVVTIIEAIDSSIPILVGSPDLLESVTGFNVHRGALASMERKQLPSIAEVVSDARRIVVLEDIVDHTNVGAIFRSVAGIGADAVLVSPRCADPLYRRSVRVSMGTVFQVPWTRMTHWQSDIVRLRAAGFVIAALALDEESVPLGSFAAPERVALLLGGEGHGLSASVVADADVVVRIPMRGGVDSLNVAAAAAVAMWELRQEGSAGLR